MIRFIFPKFSDFYYSDVFLSIAMLTILLIIAIILFAIIVGIGLKKRINERIEKNKIMFKSIQQFISITDDTFFGLDIDSGEILYSDNMEPRFGWHFPKKISKSDREDPVRIWQIYEEDEDALRQMYTDSCHDGKTVSKELRLLDKNREYTEFTVKFSPVLDKGNNVKYLVGNIVHD